MCTPNALFGSHGGIIRVHKKAKRHLNPTVFLREFTENYFRYLSN